MRRLEPQVFLVGETHLNYYGMEEYFKHINATKWYEDNIWHTSTGSVGKATEAEKLIEVMGRLCYKSFSKELNANLTKVREGNDVYLANIIKVAHGSVIEHSMTNWIFADVSRVFTAELCRHRAGTAISECSLRFVRLTDLGLWLPDNINADPELVKLFESTFKNLEELQLKLADYLKLDEAKDFGYKKEMTSAMRRLAPLGLATTIGFSMNFRALRHIIEMRTSKHAEAEIRFVMDKVATIAKERWPNIMQDFSRNEHCEWVTENSKI